MFFHPDKEIPKHAHHTINSRSDNSAIEVIVYDGTIDIIDLLDGESVQLNYEQVKRLQAILKKDFGE